MGVWRRMATRVLPRNDLIAKRGEMISQRDTETWHGGIMACCVHLAVYLHRYLPIRSAVLARAVLLQSMHDKMDRRLACEVRCAGRQMKVRAYLRGQRSDACMGFARH